MATTTPTRTIQQFQVYFTAFPGIERVWPDSPYKGIGGHAPVLDLHPHDDEAIQDGAMAMADWALDTAGELFCDAPRDDYEAWNDASITIAEAIMVTLDGHSRVENSPENPRCFWRWTQDMQIVPGVVVRCAHFEHEAPR